MARRLESAVKTVLAGRARDALFDLAADHPRVVEIDTARIRPHPDQPRRQIDPYGIAELAGSIERHGLLQPIVVKEADGGYVLVAGQRRLMAHAHLGRERIAALITTGESDELALIENLQREDLHPLDEAASLAALKARHGYSLDDLTHVLAKAKSTISELLSLDDLAPAIKAEVRTSERPLPKSVLIEIARAGDAAAQARLWADLKRSTRPTVRGARQAKRPTAPAPGRGVLATARRLLAELDRLDEAGVGDDPTLRELLGDVRRRLDRLLPD